MDNKQERVCANVIFFQVAEFVFGEARDLGLWTGRFPDNKRAYTLRDRLPFGQRCDIL